MRIFFRKKANPAPEVYIIDGRSSAVAFGLGSEIAQRIVLERDPHLLAYLASGDRVEDSAADSSLLADRLAAMSLSKGDQLTAAVAALESQVEYLTRDVAESRKRLKKLENRTLSPNQVGWVALGVLVAAVGLIAGVVQVLDWLQ